MKLASTVGLAFALLSTSALTQPATILYGLKGGGQLLEIDTYATAGSTVGPTGVSSLSGMDVQPGTGTVFASSGFLDGGQLYTIDLTTGATTLIGPTGFAAVPAIAFDPATGILYGSAATASDAVSMRLITINPVTGAGTSVGLFGNWGGNTVGGLDSLAFHPTTGVLYAGTGSFFDGTPGDIFTIDTTTGAATLLTSLHAPGSSALIPGTLAGLAFDPVGRLYGSIGSINGNILSIDLASSTFEILLDATNNSVTDIIAPCTASIPYGVGCAGSGGVTPRLKLSGCPTSGKTMHFSLTRGVGGGLAFIFVGAVPAATPLGGGCFGNVSPLTLVFGAIPTGGVGPGTGSLAFSTVVPPGVPPVSITIQAFIADSGVPIGFSNTNGVETQFN